MRRPSASTSWTKSIEPRCPGAVGSASLYSLIETAKANRIELFAYLRTIFTELPKATSLEDIEALVPLQKKSAENNAA